MLKVETYIQNPELHLNNQAERYIPSKYFPFNEYKESSLYCYIEIYEDSKLVFDGSLERCPDYWFIIMQIMQQTLEDGQGEWEFPTLLRLEAVDSGTVRLTQNETASLFSRNALFKALLNECKQLLESMGTHTEYPPEAMESFYQQVDAISKKIG